jgi:hypothetical protein
MVSRRAFLGVVTGGLLAAPLFIEAQQAGKVYRVGVLSPGSSQAASSEIAVLRQSLRELGYIEHQNIRIDWYFAEARSEGLSALAAEVVRLRPDLIFTINTSATTAAKAATSWIATYSGAARFSGLRCGPFIDRLASLDARLPVDGGERRRPDGPPPAGRRPPCPPAPVTMEH